MSHLFKDASPIPGFDKYFVDKLGNVWSTERGEPKLMSQFDSGNGYNRVCLTKSGKWQSYDVHRLVAATFLGKTTKSQPYVLHWNDDRKDNRLENLRYGSQKENINDSKRNGTFPEGERQGKSKLTVSQILAIRKKRAAGETLSSIAREFDITPSHVGNIFKRQWRSVR